MKSLSNGSTHVTTHYSSKSGELFIKIETSYIYHICCKNNFQFCPVIHYLQNPTSKIFKKNLWLKTHQFSSVQFSHSVVSDSLRPHESQHARPPCPSPTRGVHSDSHPSSPWCHPAILSSVVPFSCPQSLPASEAFPMSQLFSGGGQSTGVSALTSFLPKKPQGWSPSEWTGWISFAIQGTLKSLLQHHSSKASSLRCSEQCPLENHICFHMHHMHE